MEDSASAFPLELDASVGKAERRMRDMLLRIARDAALAAQDFPLFTNMLTERVCEALAVERAGVWFLTPDRQRLECADLFDAAPRAHEQKESADMTAYPAYFAALDAERALAAHDAMNDPRTAGFRDTYLIPKGIGAMLDATVRRSGTVYGAVCVEHVGGPRIWTLQEQNFVASVADFVAIALEMDERRSAEEALRQSEERYRGFIGLSAEGIWRIDLDPPVPIDLPVQEQVYRIAREGRYAECNMAYARMHGFASPADVIGRTTHDFVPYEIYAPLMERTVESGYTVQELEIVRPDADKTERWFSLNVLGTVIDGKLVHFWGVQREVTQTIQHLSALEFQATHDSLTSLWNRDWLYRSLDHALARERRAMALLMIDIDNLREINDSIGHESGDVLLASVSRRLTLLARERGFDVARFGGDEFAIVTDEALSTAQAADLATAILDSVREPHELGGISVELGASVGIAFAPLHATDAQTLLRRAEVAMYAAKADLRKYSFYDSERDPHSASRLALVAGLSAAIRRNELCVYFQPKIDLQNHRLAGFEALVRWQHPIQGLVPPSAFMPFAERSDVIRPLTFHILENALGELRRWKTAAVDTSVAVNLSPRNLLDEEAPSRIEGLVAKLGIEPHSLILEITESSMMHDPIRSLETLRQIAALGVRLSIDDFGTGYSSLAYLKRLPIDELKIDLGFVTHMMQNAEDRMIVQSTIGLGHNLGLSVTAEGVEDRATLDALRDMGCDCAQGYFFARPMPAGEVLKWAAGAPWERQNLAP